MRLLTLLFVSFTAAIAGARGLSATRADHESFDQARARSLMTLGLAQVTQDLSGDTYLRRTPNDVKVPLQNLDIQKIPELPSYEVLINEFNYVRDSRFLNTGDPKFPRRLTWLYPDDGCYARAEMAKNKLLEHKQIAPKKIFVFGNLTASTRNTLSGKVSWWYHVAATYRLADTVYVFDPSINPVRPVTLDEWNLAVGGAQTSVKYAICAAHAFDPNSNCENPQETSLSYTISEQTSFLSPEWERLLMLNRDPKEELGDLPP